MQIINRDALGIYQVTQLLTKLSLFTSGDDANVLSEGVHLDGEVATTGEKFLAGMFVLLPISGKAVGKTIEFLVGYARTAESLTAGGRTYKYTEDYYKAVNKLGTNERVAAHKQSAKNIAEANGWVKDKKLTKQKGRDFYVDKKTGNKYGLDTQHGDFEVYNKKNKHQGSINFDGIKNKKRNPNYDL